MWTVEWVNEKSERSLGQALETLSVEQAYSYGIGKKTNSRKRRRQDNHHSSSKTRSDSAQGEVGQQDNDINQSLNDPRSPEASEEQRAQSTGLAAAGLSQNCEMNVELRAKHFYLYRPNTTADLKCLIPIEPGTSIRDVLSGKTVLEFPTIYVRPESPEHLPTPFISEEEYLQRYDGEIPIGLVIEAKDAAEDNLPVEIVPGPVNHEKVIEVLARDLDR